MKQCGIMGVVIFTTIIYKNQPDLTQVQTIFSNEVMC